MVAVLTQLCYTCKLYPWHWATLTAHTQQPDRDLLKQEKAKGGATALSPLTTCFAPESDKGAVSFPAFTFSSIRPCESHICPADTGDDGCGSQGVWGSVSPRSRPCVSRSISRRPATLPDHPVYWGNVFILGKVWLFYPQCHAWLKKLFKAKAALAVKLPRI